MTLDFKGLRIAWWIIFLFVAVCFAFIIIAFPKAYDEWWYWAERLYYGVDENGHHNMMTGILESWHYHWNYDNSRLANFAFAATLHIPRICAGIFLALCFAAGLWFMCKVAEIRQGDIAKLVCLCFLFIFPNIWQEAFFSYDYAFNYIVPLPMFFGLIYVFLNKEHFSIGWSIALGILLGMWHESFATPIICGGALLLLLGKVKPTRWRIAMLISLAVGLLWILLPPGAWRRASWQTLELSVGRIIWLALPFAFLFIEFILLLRKKSRSYALSPLPILTAVCCLILFCITLLTGYVRASFPAIMLSATTVVYLLSKIFRPFFEDKTALSFSFSAVFFAIIAIHLIAVCHETVIVRRVYDNANNAMIFNAKKNDNAVFAEIRFPWDASPLALGRPDINMYRPRFYHFSILNLFTGESFRHMVVPSELKYYKRGEGNLIGDNIRQWRGHIVSENISDTINCWANISYGSIPGTSPLENVVFQTADGNQFVYICPIRPLKAILAPAPTSIEFISLP